MPGPDEAQSSDGLLLQLVSPERMLIEEPVAEVQIPALAGFIGVLPGHAPLVSELTAGGVLTYKAASGGEKSVALYGDGGYGYEVAPELHSRDFTQGVCC